MSDFRFASYLYEGSTGRLYHEGVDVPLAPRAAALLEHLLARAGEVCTKEALLAEVWEGATVGEESLTQAVSVLRGALGDDPKRPVLLETIQRRGYRFIGEVQRSGSDVPTAEDGHTRSARLLPWAVAASVLVALVALAWPESTTDPLPGTAGAPIRFTIDLGDAALRISHNQLLALAPDGSRLALVRPDSLYLRELDDESIVRINRTERAGIPFFSPDGRELIFHRNSSLERVALVGGMPTPMATTRPPHGGHWTDGSFFFGRGSQGIFRYSLESGEMEQVVRLEAGQAARDPQLLPGGEWLIYTLGGGDGTWNDAQLVAHHLESGERRTLAYGTALRYLPTGHLVFARNDALWAVAFDAERIEVIGDPVLMVEEILQAPTFGSAQYAVSDTGTLAYLSGVIGDGAARPLKWVDAGGDETVIDTRASVDNPRLSPDERFVAAIGPANNDTAVWIHELGRSWTLLTTGGHGVNPIWSPDGNTVYFESTRGGTSAIWRRSIDFSGPAERVWGPPVDRVTAPESMTADGRFLYFTTIEGGNIDSWVLDLSGEPSARPVEGINTTGANEGSGMVHPSAALLAYVSDESGIPEVYMRELIEPSIAGRRWKVSGADGGNEPRWSRDGTVLYYRAEDRLIAVDIRLEPEFAPLESQVVIESLVAELPRARTEYDVSADGRVLIAGPEGFDPSTFSRVHVVVNWFHELVRRVPPPSGTR